MLKRGNAFHFERDEAVVRAGSFVLVHLVIKEVGTRVLLVYHQVWYGHSTSFWEAGVVKTTVLSIFISHYSEVKLREELLSLNSAGVGRVVSSSSGEPTISVAHD